MSDPLPADVRQAFEWMIYHPGATFSEADFQELARQMLAAHPKPAPAWQPGDVLLDDGHAFLRSGHGWFGRGTSGTDIEPGNGADLIARGGHRVHPARFHDHAITLHAAAVLLLDDGHAHASEDVDRIADDMDPDA